MGNIVGTASPSFKREETSSLIVSDSESGEMDPRPDPQKIEEILIEMADEFGQDYQYETEMFSGDVAVTINKEGNRLYHVKIGSAFDYFIHMLETSKIISESILENIHAGLYFDESDAIQESEKEEEEEEIDMESQTGTTVLNNGNIALLRRKQEQPLAATEGIETNEPIEMIQTLTTKEKFEQFQQNWRILIKPEYLHLYSVFLAMKLTEASIINKLKEDQKYKNVTTTLIEAYDRFIKYEMAQTKLLFQAMDILKELKSDKTVNLNKSQRNRIQFCIKMHTAHTIQEQSLGHLLSM